MRAGAARKKELDHGWAAGVGGLIFEDPGIEVARSWDSHMKPIGGVVPHLYCQLINCKVIFNL